jgi:ParB family chromosome partitioning protein
MIQPIVARRVGTRLEIVAGERRWRAARAARLERVPVLVREATDEEMLGVALIENIQRDDLNAIERARAYRRLCDEFGLSPEEIGQRVGEDRTTVTNYLRLLELPREVMDLVSQGDISMGHARCILGVEGAGRQSQLARAVKENQLSVRALEEIVRREKTARGIAGRAGAARAPKSAHLADLERQFERALGTRVTIREGRRSGHGQIVIEYHGLDDFDRIAATLGVTPEDA